MQHYFFVQFMDRHNFSVHVMEKDIVTRAHSMMVAIMGEDVISDTMDTFEDVIDYLHARGATFSGGA